MKKTAVFTLTLLVLSTIGLQTTFAQVTLEGHTDIVYSVAFSPDGTTLASASWDDTVKLWDVATHENIATLEGHTDYVNSVSFSPDGTTLASASWDGTVKLWDVATHENIATLEGHTDYVNSVSFSPDGKILASGSQDNTVKLWDAATRTNIATLQGRLDVFFVSFSPDGTLLASGAFDGTVKLWDVATHTNIATLEGHEFVVSSVSFSPDGTTLASGAFDGTVKLWDVATRTNIATLQGHTHYVNSVAFSPDGKILASGSQDNTVKLWDAATHTNIATLQGWRDVNSVVFSPDGTTLAYGSNDNTVKLLDVAVSMRTLAKISGDEQQGTFSSTLANPLVVEVRDRDNNPLQGVQVTFTVTYGDGLLNGQFTVEHVTTDASGRAARTLTLGPDPGTNTVEVSIAGKWVTFNAEGISPYQLAKISGDEQRSTFGLALANPLVVEVRDRDNNPLPDVQVTFTVTYGDGLLNGQLTVEHVTTDANGKAARTLTLGPGTNTVEVSIGHELVTFNAVGFSSSYIATLEGHRGSVSSVAFSPDGTTLASGSYDGEVKLWDVATHTNIATLEGHRGTVSSVSFSPDGTTLASGSYDVTVKLWDVATGTNIATLEGHRGEVNSVSFSPDGKTLASGGSEGWNKDGTVKLWDVETKQYIATFVGHTDDVTSVAFSPDGKTFASGGGFFDRTVKLWDVATGTNIATLQEHTDWVNSVAFSPDRKTLASGSSDGTVKLWDMSPYITPITPPESLTGDVNQDGVVNILDLVLVASNLGQTGQNAGDVNGDGVVNILDLVKVAGALGNAAAAPSLHPQALEMFTSADVHQWLTQAQHLKLTDAISQRGILFLEQLLAALIPKETALLPNYPNPFNPETWIPYRLAKDAFVTLTIYNGSGRVVRTLDVGYRTAAFYESRAKAIYWDGRNEFGEGVASGVYFYHLSAGDYSATRKMLILK